MIPFRRFSSAPVTDKEMDAVYAALKTPVKHGAVMKIPGQWTDSPTVFLHNGVFYMYFISIDEKVKASGYETHLARSEDLLHWEYVGTIFRRGESGHWDSRQCAGYAAYFDIAYGGSNTLKKVNGSYYISYLGGNLDGYETDPLSMGLAKSADPTDCEGFSRFPEPMLAPADPDVRPYEEKTLYKSFLFHDEKETTGYPYVNIYNAKDNENRERIYLAVSNDGEHFERYGDRAVLDLMTNDPDGIITGDPQIVKIGDLYCMLFFRYRKGEGAYNTFAVSRDLVDWRVWEGTPLVAPEFPWENVHAHKTWFLRHAGKNHHFYCAVNSNGERFIALATS